MHRAGVGILAGTDAAILAGTYAPMIGFDLHDELMLLVRAGLTPMEALQAATLNPAKFLGKLHDQGTVEKGKLADLVLLDANPLQDISNTQKISAVVVGGKLIAKSELQEMLAKVEAAANKN
jgi:imidazolonepropionase-like amidohydrolase